MKSTFFVTNVSTSQACLKVINSEGRELSLSFQDSSTEGVPTFDRVMMAGFTEPAESLVKKGKDLGAHMTLKVDYASEEDFLHALANHLGYDLVKR